jgi:beta-alanine degradation protein BauB
VLEEKIMVLHSAITTMPSDQSSPNDALRHWPQHLQDEFAANQFNGCVGSVLVSETDRVRVWHLQIPRGGRCGFHRHVLDYFWTCHVEGKARGYYNDGRIVDVVHHKGQTKHFHYGAGEYMAHSVENIGDTDLLFTTVEFLDSANRALPIPDSVRLIPST